MTKALHIPVDGPIEPVEFNGLEDLQKLVGGYIEAIPVPVEGVLFGKHRLSAYIDEEGKLKGLPLNIVASAMYRNGKDYIAGPMVLFGPYEGEDESDIPEEVVQLLSLGPNRAIGEDPSGHLFHSPHAEARGYLERLRRATGMLKELLRDGTTNLQVAAQFQNAPNQIKESSAYYRGQAAVYRKIDAALTEILQEIES